MLIEIMEALEAQYANDEETLSECYVWLRKYLHSVNTFPLVCWVDERNRCRRCGTEMSTLYRNNWHPEVQCVEETSEMVCPNCGE